MTDPTRLRDDLANALCTVWPWDQGGGGFATSYGMDADTDDLIDALVAAIQGLYVPPPPGSTAEQLPAAILARTSIPPYLSNLSPQSSASRLPIIQAHQQGVLMSRAERSTAAYVALLAGHDVGDHWIQTDAWAVAKGQPGPEGVRACAAHVATYTATQAATLYAADRLLGLRLDWRRAAAGLAVSAITHYVADRQGGHWRDAEPRGVVKLAAVTGHSGWLQRDPGAGYLLDQSWHKGWIAVAAALIGTGDTP